MTQLAFLQMKTMHLCKVQCYNENACEIYKQGYNNWKGENMYEIIVSDLDGTLFRSDKTISAYTVSVLKEYEKLGYKIIFATARPPRETLKFLPADLKKDIVICYNGALIINEGKILYKRELNRETVLNIIQLAESYEETNICLEINDRLYSNFCIKSFFGDINFKNIDLWNLAFNNVYKVMICNSGGVNPDLIQNLPKECRPILTDGGTLCQIMHPVVSKWNGIQFLMKRLNISEKRIITFGDDYNDMEMIMNCGLGVAVGNAVDAIKKTANHTTLSNDDDGVATFLDQYKKG